jgi:hypothetical protein
MVIVAAGNDAVDRDESSGRGAISSATVARLGRLGATTLMAITVAALLW